MRTDAVTLEVAGNGLLSIAEQMGVALIRTAYSPNIKERRDASVAIFDPEGKLLALAQHIPIHFSSLFSVVHEVRHRWPPEEIREGDVFIANDPYTGGGSHLPDVVLVQPVFFEGRLAAFLANLGHHADRPHRGTTIYDEGLRIPAVKLYDRGRLVEDVFRLILLNYELVEERRGDLRAQEAANRYGEQKMKAFCRKVDYDGFRELAQEWLRYGARKARSAIRPLPDGEYTFEDYLDDDGYGNRHLPIRVRMVVEGERLAFDFTGSHPQVTGPFNCVESALRATVYYAVKAVLDPSIPANSGFFDAIHVSAPAGTIVNASEPAATYDRETTCQRIGDVVFGAFSKLTPESVTAAGNGAVCFFTFSGENRRTGKPYVYVETIGGGSGARASKDGLDAVQVHVTNSSNLPVEALEMDYPLRVEAYELVPDSGGAGRYRGGLAIRRTIRVTPESRSTRLVAAIERHTSGPWGLFGGRPGSCSHLKVLREGTTLTEEPKIQLFPLTVGDRVELVTPGAGGYGPPSERQWELIERDLREEKISRQAARDDYGFES